MLVTCTVRSRLSSKQQAHYDYKTQCGHVIAPYLQSLLLLQDLSTMSSSESQQSQIIPPGAHPSLAVHLEPLVQKLYTSLLPGRGNLPEDFVLRTAGLRFYRFAYTLQTLTTFR